VRVLVSGAAGSIGQVVTVGLTERGHEVVALDRVPAPEGSALPWHTGDCADADFVAAVFDAQSVDGEPLEGVVHLAGHPDEASLPDSIRSHTVTTAALLDAMVEHGVRRFVYAGSNHAVGRTPRTRDTEVTVDHRPRPDTFYGVAKVAAEAVMSLYADRYGIDAVSCRIGSFRSEPSTVRHLSTWLSHDDCVRMVEASLTAPAPGYAVLYGISATPAPGGTSPRAALSATTLRTTRRRSRRASRRASRTTSRRRTSAGRSSPRSSSAPRSTARRRAPRGRPRPAPSRRR